MGKSVQIPASDGGTLEIDLKDPWLAAFLAWLLPGLGHFYQGRTGKGLLFFICIVGTFLYGLYIGDGRVVYASPNPLTRWHYFCQLGVGLPALPAIVQRSRFNQQKPPLVADVMRPPRMQQIASTDAFGNEVVHPDELAKWHHDLSDRFEIGTVFTIVAGLLNLLVIYDAYGGPLVIPLQTEKKEPEREDSSG
jgi:hypothetical protein